MKILEKQFAHVRTLKNKRRIRLIEDPEKGIEAKRGGKEDFQTGPKMNL